MNKTDIKWLIRNDSDNLRLCETSGFAYYDAAGNAGGDLLHLRY